MSKAITSADFDEIIASADKPVLVDFWAPWCGPCRALGPVLEAVAEEFAGKLDVYKCNVDDESDLAERFDVVSIPTMLLFKGGEVAHTMVGSMRKPELVAEIAANL